MRTIGRPLMLLAGALCFAAVGCDDEDTIVTGESVGLRVIHASPDAPALDVYLAGQSTPVAQNLGYGQATARLTVPTGTVRIELRPAGAATATPAPELRR